MLIRFVNSVDTFVNVLVKDCRHVIAFIEYFNRKILSTSFITLFVLSKWKIEKNYYLYFSMKDEFTRTPITTWNDKKCFLMRSKNVLTSPELAEKHLWSNPLISSTCMVFSFRNEEHVFSIYHIFFKNVHAH